MVDKLVHEMWRSPDGLTTVCLAGPNGAGARSQLDPKSELVLVFKASSHYEAMTLYHNRMGWGKYQTDQQWDIRPYPAEWVKVQAQTAQDWKAFHKGIGGIGGGLVGSGQAKILGLCIIILIAGSI